MKSASSKIYLAYRIGTLQTVFETERKILAVPVIEISLRAVVIILEDL